VVAVVVGEAGLAVQGARCRVVVLDLQVQVGGAALHGGRGQRAGDRVAEAAPAVGRVHLDRGQAGPAVRHGHPADGDRAAFLARRREPLPRRGQQQPAGDRRQRLAAEPVPPQPRLVGLGGQVEAHGRGRVRRGVCHICGRGGHHGRRAGAHRPAAPGEEPVHRVGVRISDGVGDRDQRGQPAHGVPAADLADRLGERHAGVTGRERAVCPPGEAAGRAQQPAPAPHPPPLPSPIPLHHGLLRRPPARGRSLLEVSD
jgi:hypothetical protein